MPIRPDGRSHRSHRRRETTVDRGPNAFAGPWRQTINFYALLVLLGACALGGGTAFADVLSLLYVRPIAVMCLILFLLTPARIDWPTFKVPIILLCVFAFLMAIQLVPLPPSWWASLPGRGPYVEAALAAGMAQPWRPISLAPDLTMNSLVSLVVPAAVLVGVAKLREDQRQATVILLISLCCASALIGIGQLAGGEASPLYLYQRTYPGFAVGLLSNRNHQAALLALLFPALRVWTLMPGASRSWTRNRQWLALAIGILTTPVILATGSRAGMALGALGVAASFVLFSGRRSREREGASRWQRYFVRITFPIFAIALVILTYLFGRATSIERLISLSAIDSDQRFQFAPTVLHIIRDSFPVGTGFGSFDPVFRQYEPDSILISSFFNHAHNELLELVIMAGLPGVLLLMALLMWWGTRMAGSVRAVDTDPSSLLVRLGGVIVAFLLLVSLVDYPLRAPLMAAVFAIGCALICGRRIADHG